jgi:predicted lipid carrier protein YhbT
VHRVDAEAAAGKVAPIPADLAVDGIDEFLDVFLRARATFVPDTTLAGSLHLHCTDAEGEWLVSVVGGVIELAREHGKGDAAIRGSASNLLLLLWNRIDEAGIETFGDPAVLAARRAIAM